MCLVPASASELSWTSACERILSGDGGKLSTGDTAATPPVLKRSSLSSESTWAMDQEGPSSLPSAVRRGGGGVDSVSGYATSSPRQRTNHYMGNRRPTEREVFLHVGRSAPLAGAGPLVDDMATITIPAEGAPVLTRRAPRCLAPAMRAVALVAVALVAAAAAEPPVCARTATPALARWLSALVRIVRRLMRARLTPRPPVIEVGDVRVAIVDRGSMSMVSSVCAEVRIVPVFAAMGTMPLASMVVWGRHGRMLLPRRRPCVRGHRLGFAYPIGELRRDRVLDGWI